MNNISRLGNCNSSKICPKGGVKIYETNNNNNSNNIQYDPVEFYNNLKNQNKATGVRINQTKNEYTEDPFGNVNPFSNPYGEKDLSNISYTNANYNTLDLNIDSYSREDIYKLFGIQTVNLNDEIMREAKKIVLKTHPDKSRLDQKYFLFFSKAYKRLYGIYEFQNKSTKKVEDKNEYFSDEKNEILNNMFEKNKSLKGETNFNTWFNDQFEKQKLEDSADTGYGDWLKSNEDIVDVSNVSKANMAAEIDKIKKQVQSITVYNGVNEIYSSSFGGSTLMEYDNNFTSGTLFSNEGMGYTDLKQAYVESVIPITEDDYNKIPKFKNIEEYKRHRDNAETKPLEKEESLKQLYHQNKQKDEESAALAFHYAKQSEIVKKNNDTFWSGLKQLGW
jgi:hypothetical protein